MANTLNEHSELTENLYACQQYDALPVLSLVLPEVELAMHTVSTVWVHAVFTPRVHVDSAAHAAHGALHESENDVPATHVLYRVPGFVFLYTLLPELEVS